jgi:homoserine O-acetyltransferase
MAITQSLCIGNLALRSGDILHKAELAFTTYGHLADGGDNAILITHGFTSSHQFIEEGGWATLVGPGCAIDTDRFFVVSSNMLGSSYGSTAPASIDPKTARPYGPDFPPITLQDIVDAQYKLLSLLGIQQLVAVIGPSYGGFQAFTWGVAYPDFVRTLVPVESAPKAQSHFDGDAFSARFALDPNWNSGRYYATGGIDQAMIALRVETLRRYGVEEGLKATLPDQAAIDAEITRQARDWSTSFDAHSILVLGRALNTFDVTPDLGRVRARVLYVLSRTDALFPPSLAPQVMAALKAAKVDASYFEIDTEHGHFGSDLDVQQWAPRLKSFLSEPIG